MVITTELLKEITLAAKTSEFAKQKLESARKSYAKIKNKIGIEQRNG